jgi:2,2-dialkylglycine decarboxylase (pyruvate)
MAMSSVQTSDAIADVADRRGFMFVTTHVNDPLPASVALKVLEIIQRDQLVERSRVLGSRLRMGLQNLMHRHPCIGDVRGRGLLLGMEFVPFEGQSSTEISRQVTEIALERGLSANITGAYTSGTMRFAPPINSTDEEIDFGLSVLDASISQVMESIGK